LIFKGLFNFCFWKNIKAKALIKSAKAESKNDDPKIAPVPISTPSAAFPLIEKIAIKGRIVSGSAVPTAAKIEPVALLSKLNFLPKFSIEFVNKLQVRTIDKR